MGSSKRFWMGMFIGAMAGGAVSLFEKSTRQAVKADFRKVSDSVTYIAKNPNEFIEEIKETANKLRSTVEQVTEDVSFIAEKVEEMKEVPPQVSDLVKETKLAFNRVHSSDSK